MKIPTYKKYAVSTEDALDLIEVMTRIVVRYNDTFNKDIKYSIDMLRTSKEGYKWKIVFDIHKHETVGEIKENTSIDEVC